MQPMHAQRIRGRGMLEGEAPDTPWATKEDGPGYPAIEASPPHVLTWNHNRYIVMRGRLIPSFSKFPLVDGVNNVSIDRKGNIHFATARAGLETRGFSVIPESWGPPDNRGTRSYQRRIKTVPKGYRTPVWAHISAWETCYPGDTRSHSDEDGYVAWCESLVDQGLVPRCPQHIAYRMLEHARAELLNAAERQAQKASGVGAVRVASLQAQVDVLTEVAEGAPSGRPVAAESAELSGVDTEAR